MNKSHDQFFGAQIENSPVTILSALVLDWSSCFISCSKFSYSVFTFSHLAIIIPVSVTESELIFSIDRNLII